MATAVRMAAATAVATEVTVAAAATVVRNCIPFCTGAAKKVVDPPVGGFEPYLRRMDGRCERHGLSTVESKVGAVEENSLQSLSSDWALMDVSTGRQ